MRARGGDRIVGGPPGLASGAYGMETLLEFWEGFSIFCNCGREIRIQTSTSWSICLYYMKRTSRSEDVLVLSYRENE